MSAPEVVRIKRKRGEDAPDALVVERSGKRHHGVNTYNNHYVRKKEAAIEEVVREPTPSLFSPAEVQRQVDNSSPRPKSKSISGNGFNGGSSAARERRTYHLKRPSTPEAGIKKRKAGRLSKGKDDGIATFVEKRVKMNTQAMLDLADSRPSSNGASISPEKTFKRPTARAVSGVVPSASSSLHNRSNSRAEAIANSLHQFAVEQIAKESQAQKPKLTSMPKLTGQRSRALHQQRASQSSIVSRTQDQDTVMDDDADYVYDTYVLAPSSGIAAAQVDTPGGLGNVGYLVIGEEDEAVWETYMEEEASEDDPSDEDDENAEDWYGADYPDDELASDDEFGRNVYGYRANGASDDEEYDEHTFSDDEWERQMNPWKKKTPQQFSKYFDGAEKKAAGEQ